MQRYRLRKYMSPLNSPHIRTSAIWEIQQMPGILLRRIDHLSHYVGLKGWHVQFEGSEGGQDPHPEAYGIWRFLHGRSFRTRKEALEAVGSAQTYLQHCPPERKPAPF